jgi:hypothetical protein
VFKGKTVAIVGSGPGSLDNAAGVVDGHDVVVRVNNYVLRGEATGRRTDVYYSFFGNSIHKDPVTLQRDGVFLCMCKCPDGLAVHSPWHVKNNKMHGVDFRWIYDLRRSWWFCDTYIPTVEEFRSSFDLLGGHIPTTGFAAILEVFHSEPRAIYLTGFDFFKSGVHNLDKPWRQKNTDDPVGHVPEKELAWIRANREQLTVDKRLAQALG